MPLYQSVPKLFPVLNYGARGVATDDGPAIQNAINAAQAYGAGSIVVFDSLTYNVTTSLTLDPSLCGIEGNGAVFNCTSMTSGPFMTIQMAESGTGQANWRNAIQRFSVEGPSGNSAVDCFLFTQSGSNIAAIVDLRNVCVNGFRHACYYGNNAYIINFEDSIFVNQTGSTLYIPSGNANNGEGLNFHHCLLAQGQSYVVDSESTNGTNLQFTACSFDFNAFLFNQQGGQIECDACHFEMQGSALTAPIIVVGNVNGASVRWRGGAFFLDGTGPFSGSTNLFSVGASGSLVFDNVFFHNINLSSGVLSATANTGLVMFKDTVGYNTSAGCFNISDITAPINNLMMDGGFEGTIADDNIYIAGDTVAITNRYNNSGNIVLSYSSAYYESGSQSLEASKAGASSTTASFIIAVPIRGNCIPIGSYYYRWPGAGTGSIFVTWRWGVSQGNNSSGIPVIVAPSSTNTIQTDTITTTGSDTGWVQKGLKQNTSNRVPACATHLLLLFNMNGIGSGALYVDNVVLQQM